MNEQTAPAKSDTLRLKVLLLLLVLTVAIFGYDVGIAKRGWEGAIAKLQDVVSKTEKLETDKSYGPKDVQKLLGREPVASGAAKEAPHKIPSLLKSSKPEDWEHKLGHFEVYQWRRGIPFLKYSIFVAYTGPQQNPVFYQFQPGGKMETSLFRGVKMPDPEAFKQLPKLAKKQRGGRGAKKGNVLKAPAAGGDRHGKSGDDKDGAEKGGGKKDTEEKAPKKAEGAKKTE